MSVPDENLTKCTLLVQRSSQAVIDYYTMTMLFPPPHFTHQTKHTRESRYDYQGRMQDFKKLSKFLNKFPAQPYLGYFRYQWTMYQFFQIYYIIFTVVIIIVILLSLLLLLLSLLLLALFPLKSWSVVGLWGFRFH